MDKVAFKALLREGVEVCERGWNEYGQDEGDDAIEARVGTTIDRLAQIGVLALEHENEWLWSETVAALLDVYRLAVPEDWRAWNLATKPAKWILSVIYRVDTLGAAATITKRFAYLRTLVLQHVGDDRPDYWRRYAVTIASRAKVSGAMPGKSTIGPIAEFVRQRPQFDTIFKSDPARVVNSLCQFDFLGCVAVVAESQDIDRAYPNFGAYYSDRTLPIIHDLIRGGASREALPPVTDRQLAEILAELNKVATHWFFDVNGWDGYDRPVLQYIHANNGVVED